MNYFKRITALLLVLVMCLGITACGKNNEQGTVANVTPTVTPGENDGEDTGVDKGTWDELNADQIVEAMGAGYNVGNQLEGNRNGTPYETAWNSTPITPQLIAAIKEAGFSSVRIPVSYLSKIDDANNFTIDEKWLDRVQQVVDYCIAEDLFVIINVHGDGYDTITGGWLLPDAVDQDFVNEKYAAVWKQISEKFKDYDERVIFESMNEIGANNACTAELYKNINRFNQTFLDTIRQTGGNNDKRWVLVPGYNTNIDQTATNKDFVIPFDTYLSEDIPEGEHRIMISVHYYDPWSFCGGETDDATQWGVDAEQSKTANWGDEAYLEAQFKKLYDSFTSQGYPVIIGEYGAIDKSRADESSTYYRAYFCKSVCETAKKYGCVPVYWDNGYNGNYGFGLFDRKTFEMTQPEIIAAIVGVYSDNTQTEGGATSVTISETEITLEAGTAEYALTATTDTGEAVTWTSDDFSVATVSKDGFVTPQLAGTCTITASCGSAKAECTVTVVDATSTVVKLYILETAGWQTCASEESVELTGPGQYTLTMTASKENLERIGSFYIKDSQCQNGVLSKSLATKAKATIQSITVNGVELTLQGSYANVNMVNNQGTLDFCILNEWVLGTELIQEFEMNGSDYKLNVELADTNEISVTFVVSELTY
ncbi:MAG: cellulase family glycosylhydrolase [Lachnospiraceae bacterium]